MRTKGVNMKFDRVGTLTSIERDKITCYKEYQNTHVEWRYELFYRAEYEDNVPTEVS